jgi:hypothetical protein
LQILWLSYSERICKLLLKGGDFSEEGDSDYRVSSFPTLCCRT